jgi:hypothetical protein
VVKNMARAVKSLGCNQEGTKIDSIYYILVPDEEKVKTQLAISPSSQTAKVD